MAIITGLTQTFHRPVFYGYVCGSGEASSGYVNIYLNPRVIGDLIIIGTQVYTSGGVDKTGGCQTVYTPSYTAISGVVLNNVAFTSGSVVSGVLTVTPSSIVFGDIILLDVVYV